MFRKITLISFVLAFIIILAGYYLRSTGAELACPDWPGCFGQFAIGDEQAFQTKAAETFPEHTVDIDQIRKALAQVGSSHVVP